MAAGGIVIRNGPRPLIAVVQRRRDDAWVLPKGKLKPNEKPIAAAKREATEETGSEVRVHEFLGLISYVGGNGPKIAHFWRMHALDGPPGKLTGDIRAVEWLPLSAAVDRLDLPHEQSFLRNVGREALRKAVAKPPRRPVRLPRLPPLDKTPVASAPPPAELRTRWIGLSQFAKRLQEALGRSD
jgi:8-oxo-dGTP diphosphatase